MPHAPPSAPPHDPADAARAAALLEALVRGGTLLLGGDDFDAAATGALGTLARAAGMQHARLVRHVDDAGTPGRWEVAYEWHDPEVERQGAAAPAWGPVAGDDAWAARLLAGEPVLDARTADLADPALRAAQQARGARYLVAAGIFVDGAPWGALSLDDCRTERRRGDGEKAALAAAAQTLGLAVHRHRTRGEAARLERRLLDERRAAAEARAAELARANQALQRTVGRLSEVAEVQDFYAVALAEMATALCAASAGLMLFDAGRRSFSMACSVVDGAEQPLGGGPHDRQWSLDDPQIARTWAEIQRADRLLVAEIEGPYIHLDTRAWHRSRGDAAVVYLPLFRGPKPLGFVAFGVRAAEEATRVGGELASALGQQLALALELERLAREARTAAVARERRQAAEERAAELARANDALRSGLDRLSGERDASAFLRHILAAAAQALDARGAALFRFHPARNRLAMELAVNPDLPAVPPPEGVRPFVADADATPYWRLLVEGRRPLVLDAGDPAQAHLFWPGTREWHLEHSQPLSVGVPLVLGSEPLGFVGFTLDPRAVVTAERLGLVQALAHQAALALHLTHLSEETRDAAVARERERAAEERAAELARANDALRRSVASVATLRDIDAFLVEVLRNATAVAGADTGAVVLGTADDASLQMHSFVREGRALDPATDPLLAPWRDARPLKPPVADLLRRLLAGGIGWADADDPTLTGEIRAWHRRLGHARIAHIPLFRGDETIGFIALCFTAEGRPRTERLEMVRVLAQQAALALELSRLGGEAEQAAVAEERNRIAREIHDTLARGFSGIIWTLEGVKQGVAGGPDEVAARVDTALELARDSLAQARQSLWALRPGTLPRADLERELRRLAAGADGGDTRVELVVAEPAGPLGSEAQVNLLRIAEEAVNNAVRHAAARHVRIELAREGATVTLRVSDDGKGFGAESFAPGESFGLRGMRERAQRAGGQLEIDSEIGRGTTVTARVPAGAP